MTPLIAATDLRFTRNDLPVFSGIHLSVEVGQVLHVVGANGVGKSTLLRVLAGLLTRFEGLVERHYRPSEMVYVGHRLGVKDLLTVGENIGGELIKGRDLGLSNYLDTLAKDLSAGQRQRLALAKLLTRPAKLWLLDEPLSSLDREGIELFIEILEKHCLEGGAAIIVSHQPFSIKNIPVKTLALGELS